MDVSESKQHDNCDLSNKKVLCKFKDEVNGKIIKEHIGLKPKMWAMDMQDDKEQKKAKGVPKNIVKKEMNFNMYKKTLYENCNEKVKFNTICSYKHQLFSITCSKTGLSNFENKRYYVNNNLSYPHGHYLINQ